MVILVSTSTALLGCDSRHAADEGSATTASALIAPPLVAPPPLGTATVTGRVHLRGKPPTPAPIEVSGVADCARLHPDGIPDEAILVSEDGSLANCIVYLKGVPAHSAGSSPKPAVIDQKSCRYHPHVLAIQTGQPLEVQSSDPFLHNVHVMCTVNQPVNFSEQAGQGEPPSRELRFKSSEIFPIKCDVHPWMRAWVGVFDHPCFAVTAADGNFQVEHAPAGHYTLVCWHERLGELTHELDITPGQTLAADFEYSK